MATLSSDDGISASTKFTLPNKWTRLGMAISTKPDGLKTWTLKFEGKSSYIDLWGLEIVEVQVAGLPANRISQFKQQVEGVHLLPETFYIDHAAATVHLHKTLVGAGTLLATPATIDLKKCSYCQRQLPIDVSRPSALAFHKHNAKKSGHQNECRACKKWRINDTFNPLRTVDQLHESSVITRERKILLREPEILQSVKDRLGDGLKSIVWKRFNKSCFRCKTAIALKEVQLDHTRPLAYLWPIDVHATCLCAECNNHKGDRFPVDFYTEDQLTELSKIVGLPVADLKTKSLCQTELARIIVDIATFAETWDARTFNAIARKVIEIEPQTDLFEILKTVAPTTHARVIADLANRPPPVSN